MPLYEYQCDDCQGRFEELVMSEGQTVSCPSCGSQETSKLISACRFRNAGGGDGLSGMSGGSSSGCSTCSGGSCATCG
jgi:putative FmdB family regulatory protein